MQSNVPTALSTAPSTSEWYSALRFRCAPTRDRLLHSFPEVAAHSCPCALSFITSLSPMFFLAPPCCVLALLLNGAAPKRAPWPQHNCSPLSAWSPRHCPFAAQLLACPWPSSPTVSRFTHPCRPSTAQSQLSCSPALSTQVQPPFPPAACSKPMSLHPLLLPFNSIAAQCAVQLLARLLFALKLSTCSIAHTFGSISIPSRFYVVPNGHR